MNSDLIAKAGNGWLVFPEFVRLLRLRELVQQRNV